MNPGSPPKRKVQAGEYARVMSQSELDPQTGKLVDAPGLLAALFEEKSRPSLKWLRRLTKARAIPAIRVGRLIFYDLDIVRAKLVAKNTVKAM